MALSPAPHFFLTSQAATLFSAEKVSPLQVLHPVLAPMVAAEVIPEPAAQVLTIPQIDVSVAEL